MKNEAVNVLFLPSGCLSTHGMEAFLQGDLEGNSLKLVQNHLAACELCSDALEGYRKSGSAKRSLENAKEFSHEIFNTWVEKTKSSGQKSWLPVFIRVAASIVLLLGVWAIFRWMHSPMNSNNPIAVNSSADSAMSASGYYAPVSESVKKLAPPVITDLKDVTAGTVSADKPASKKETKGVQTENNILPISPAAEKLVSSSEDPRLPDPDEAILLESGNESLRPYPAGNDHVKGGPSGKGMSFYYNVDDMPRFRSGDLELFRHFVQGQIRYPRSALRDGLEGTVYVRFIVEPTGKVSHVLVVQGVSEILDREAIRVVSSSPDWRPGRHHGEKVNVGFIIPVKFQIQ